MLKIITSVDIMLFWSFYSSCFFYIWRWFHSFLVCILYNCHQLLFSGIWFLYLSLPAHCVCRCVTNTIIFYLSSTFFLRSYWVWSILFIRVPWIILRWWAIFFEWSSAGTLYLIFWVDHLCSAVNIWVCTFILLHLLLHYF